MHLPLARRRRLDQAARVQQLEVRQDVEGSEELSDPHVPSVHGLHTCRTVQDLRAAAETDNRVFGKKKSRVMIHANVCSAGITNSRKEEHGFLARTCLASSVHAKKKKNGRVFVDPHLQ